MTTGATISRARQLRRAMTDAERQLWAVLRNRTLGYKFRRQVPIGRFIADFVCVERRLVIEVDGGQHAGSSSDIERDDLMRRLGYRVLRVWNTDVLGNPHGVSAAILEALQGPSP